MLHLRHSVPILLALTLGCGADGDEALESTLVAAQAQELTRLRNTFHPIAHQWLAPQATRPGSTAARAVRVTLPSASDGPFELRTIDLVLQVRRSVDDSLAGASVNGLTVYGKRGAAAVVQRVDANGTEDFVEVTNRARAEIRYEVDTGGFAGIRQIGEVIEFLTPKGVPRIRMQAPAVIGARGRQVIPRVAVRGCAVDRNPARPWLRPVESPGADTCTLVVSWDAGAVSYPVLVDPSWESTANMSVPRHLHGLVVMDNGDVLAAGGADPTLPMSTPGNPPPIPEGRRRTEFYNPTADAWATGTDLPERRFDARIAKAKRSGAEAVVLVGGYTDSSLTTEATTQLVLTGTTWTSETLPGLPQGTLSLTRLPSSAAAAWMLVSELGPVFADADLTAYRTNYLSSVPALCDVGRNHAAVLVGSSVFLSGGRILGTGTNRLRRFDILSGNCQNMAPMPGRREQHLMLQNGPDKLIVMGGLACANPNNCSYNGTSAEYAIGTNEWVDNFPRVRAQHYGAIALALPNNWQLIAGGTADGARLVTTALLPPGGGAPERGPDLNFHRSQTAGIVLPSGDAFIAGADYFQPPGSPPLIPTPFAIRTAERLELGGPGESCASGAECLSGTCTEGVCCDSECTDACMTCDGDKQEPGGTPGICSPATVGQLDPNGRCPVTQAQPCGNTGTCAIGGVCQLASATVSCGDSECSVDGTELITQRCDGAGRCTNAPIDCGAYQCDENSTDCGGNCAGTTDCSPTSYCDNGTCVPRRAIGEACDSGDQCAGDACTDGVCCETQCDGQCVACNEPGEAGQCVAVVGSPRGDRTPCDQGSSSNPCSARTCDGQSRDQCNGFAGSDVICAFQACQDGIETVEATCDGAGECAREQKQCAPYACDGDACGTGCTSDDDCVAPSKCDTQDAQCINTATCNGSIITDATGATSDCAPYRCEPNGTCKVECGSTDDCVAPTVCNSSNVCVRPKPGANSDTGCGCAVPGRPARGPEWPLALCVLLLSARRRRATA